MSTNCTDSIVGLRYSCWKLSKRCISFLVLWSFFTTVALFAEGFRNPPPGTFNLGRSGGRIAQVDDSSAVVQNPANLVYLPDAEVQFSPTLVFFEVEYKSLFGQKAETKEPLKVLPNLFASVPLKDGRYAVGLGITVPYGISSEWKREGAFQDPTSLRYQAPFFADLKTINVSPTLAAKIGEKVSVGVGFDVMWSELTIKQQYPWFLPPLGSFVEPDGLARLKGDGFGYGGNLGITWNVTERQRLALTYRSQMDVDYDGTLEINNVTPVAQFLGATSESDFSTKVAYPNIVAVGYGIELTDTIRLGTDVEWIQFSRFKSLDIDARNNNFLLPSRKIQQDWENTFTAGIGGDWRFAPNWIFRFGYQYDKTPVPSQTISPTIPDANQNVITLGLGYSYKAHSFEVAYGLDFYDKRESRDNQNSILNGNYDFNVHLFSLAYRFRF